MRLYLLILIVFGFLPTAAQAAVYINEVAWMGDIDSANHEWIELYNDGAAVDVTGWSLTDEMNLNVDLVGTIPANSYAVLERTSDDSSTAKAFLIYTGALVNTGATLKLKDKTGGLVDWVNGGDNWDSIGGDNVTKETAQYTNSGWITAEATPGKPNKAEVIDEPVETDPEEEDYNEEDPKKTSKGIKKDPLTLPDVTLALEIKAPDSGYVNQAIEFSVEPSGVGKTIIDSLAYQWNFGDSNLSNKKDTIHIFKYPGTYVVTNYAYFKRQEQVTRHEITILPVRVELTTNQQGDVQINNNSPYEIDLSGYKLKAKNSLTLPEYSILLPNQTITVSAQKLGKVDNLLVAFYDAEGKLLDSLVPSSLGGNVVQEGMDGVKSAAQISATAVSPQNVIAVDNFAFAVAEAAEPDEEVSSLLEEQELMTSFNNQAMKDSANNWSYWVLVVVLLIGTIGVYALPKRNEEEEL